MFVNRNKYEFLVNLDSKIDDIYTELTNSINKNQLFKETIYPSNPNHLDYYTEYWVIDNGFHPKQIGKDIRIGDYATVMLFKKGYTNKLIDVHSLFPKTISIINSIPGIHFAGFFRMGPNSGLSPHKHSRKHLIYHLLLNDITSGNSFIQCENEKKLLNKKGDFVLFDYSLEHSSENLSNENRFNFVLDFDPKKLI
jgi:hypothetical protein